MKISKWDLAFAGTGIASGLMARLRRAKDVDSDGGADVTTHEAADMIVGGLEDGVNAVGAGGLVVYDGRESATNSTAGRIAEGLIAAGTTIQHALKDRTVTLGECITALRAGLRAAFAR